MQENLRAKAEGSVELFLGSEGIDKYYAHLNNAYYGPYFEKARAECLKRVGLADAYLIQNMLGLFVVESKRVHSSQLTREQIQANPKIRIAYKVAMRKAIVIVEMTMYHQEGEIEREKATETLEHCFVNLNTGEAVNPNHLPPTISKSLDGLLTLDKFD